MDSYKRDSKSSAICSIPVVTEEEPTHLDCAEDKKNVNPTGAAFFVAQGSNALRDASKMKGFSIFDERMHPPQDLFSPGKLAKENMVKDEFDLQTFSFPKALFASTSEVAVTEPSPMGENREVSSCVHLATPPYDKSAEALSSFTYSHRAESNVTTHRGLRYTPVRVIRGESSFGEAIQCSEAAKKRKISGSLNSSPSYEDMSDINISVREGVFKGVKSAKSAKSDSDPRCVLDAVEDSFCF